MTNNSITTLRQIMGICALLSILNGMSGCAASKPVKVPPEGSENEPVRQQMQRRLRPPFLDPLAPGDLFYDDGDFPPPPEEGNKPYPVKTILITGRTDSSISLRWRDRSSVEESTLLRRRVDNATGWEEAFTYGPVSGFNDVTDEGLDPDRRYCYQFIASNEHGDSPSPQRCAYTKSATILPVYRAQLRVKTAEISGAGTGNKVRVRLNSPSEAVGLPAGNVTVMDYGQNDFERGDDFFYDLELAAIDNFTDVTLISLSKDKSDGLCVEVLELWLNNTRVFSRDFSDTSDGCHWLDDDGDHSNTFTIFHESLRSHPDWQAFDPTVQLVIDRKEIESRIEGMVGHLLSSSPKAKWGDRHGRAWVEASQKDAETVRIDLDMEGEVLGPNPDIDIDFDVTARFARAADKWEFNIEASNLEATADYDWFTEAWSFILPCGPIVSIVLDEGIPDCITYLERYIEGRIQEAWRPIAQNLTIDNPCQAGFRPMATVTEFPNIKFGCVEDDGAELPNVLIIRGTTVVSQPIE